MNWQVVRERVHIEPIGVAEVKQKLRRVAAFYLISLLVAAGGGSAGVFYWILRDLPNTVFKTKMDLMEAQNVVRDCAAENNRLVTLVHDTAKMANTSCSPDGNTRNVGGSP